VGTASYTYSHVAPGTVVDITAQFRQVKDDERPGKRVDADYAFVQNPGAEGRMDFIYNVPADATSAGGVAKVRSRWQWSGAGRSDVTMTPTDLALVYQVSECWDEHYASTYKSVPLSTSAADNWGSPATCVFPTAEFSSL
jgi:hypothetical protein